MSVLLGIGLMLLYEVIKTGEEIVAVMRPRRILGMILHAEKRIFLVLQPFQRLVIQIDVRDLDLSFRKRVDIHHKVMVLGGDLNLPGLKVHDRLVIAMMPELEFRGFPSERLPDHLMPEADPEHRNLPDQFTDRFHKIFHRSRIAGNEPGISLVYSVYQSKSE